MDDYPEMDQVSKFVAGIELRCTYEEEVESPGSAPRWFELAAGIAPFHLTKYPILPSDFATDWYNLM